MMKQKIALARVNYSQLYGLYGDVPKSRDIQPPYQLLVVAGHLKKGGLEVKLFDGEVGLKTELALAKEILKWKPEIVGLTVTTPDVEQVIEVCRIIKAEDPKITTIVGGPHVRAVGRELLLEEAAVDSASVSYFDDGEPQHDLLDYGNYLFTDPRRGQLRTASVMSSYGCPFSCKFCASDKFVKYRTVDSFVQEIAHLYREHGVRYFYVYDDTFLTRKERALEIANGIKDANLADANFQCLTRANLITTEILDALKEASFVRVSMGIESGSDNILRKVDKGVTTADVVKACELLDTYDIETRGSFILGLPYETHETVRETIEFSKSIPLYHANFNLMTPYPGTVCYDMALEGKGIRFIKPEYATDWKMFRRWNTAVSETPDVCGEELQDYQTVAQVEFYTQAKVAEHHIALFEQGNKSRFFYRPLNFAWNKRHGKDIEFWKELK